MKSIIDPTRGRDPARTKPQTGLVIRRIDVAGDQPLRREAFVLSDLACARPEIENCAGDGLVPAARAADRAQRTGKQQVVRIDPVEQIARRAREPLVNGVRLAVVLLADPICQPFLVTPDDVDALVGTATVDNDVFEVWVTLQENGPNCLLDEAALIVTGRDDGNPRPG